MNDKKSIIVLGVSVSIIIALIGVSILANNNQENQTADSNTEVSSQETQISSGELPNQTQETDQVDLPSEEEDTLADSDLIKVGYVDYNENLKLSPDSKKVLFFHASWCTSCRNLDKNLSEDNFQDMDQNVVVMKVDYDKEESLKNKYKILSQHTLVEVDEGWNQIKKFTGSNNLEDISQKLN